MPISKKQVQAIRHALEHGLGIPTVAQAFNVSPSTVRNVRAGRVEGREENEDVSPLVWAKYWLLSEKCRNDEERDLLLDSLLAEAPRYRRKKEAPLGRTLPEFAWKDQPLEDLDSYVDGIVAKYGLDVSETRVLKHLLAGYTYRETAKLMHCSRATVQRRVESMQRKLRELFDSS